MNMEVDKVADEVTDVVADEVANMVVDMEVNTAKIPLREEELCILGVW